MGGTAEKATQASIGERMGQADAQRRVAIVTGASSGIGRETVRQLLAHGWRVHAAARRVEAMRDLAAAGAVVHHLDLTRDETITACAAAVLAADGRVDLLVNNAGYGCYGAIEDVPLAAARDEMDVNLFGLARMTQVVLPAMRAQRSGRIINVTSIGGKLWSPLGGWYHASKFAVEGLSDCLRNELRPFGIAVVLVEPGGTRTEWGAIAAGNARRISGTGAYAEVAETTSRLYSFDRGLASAGEIAAVICRAATVRRPRTRYVAPFAGKVILGLRLALRDRGFDWLLRQLLRFAAARPAPAAAPGQG